MKYIKSVDGITGCYRGLFPKVCGNLICAITTEKITERLENDAYKASDPSTAKDDELDGDDENKTDRRKKEDEK